MDDRGNVRAPRTGAAAWLPALGAWREGAATRFRVWAPTHEHVEVLVERDGDSPSVHSLARLPDGSFTGVFDDVRTGDRYWYRLDRRGPFPDPASRCQPDGVHGPSLVVDPAAFPWSSQPWTGIGLRDLVIYELHVGTFTPEGTFAGVLERLPYLVDLGITAIELMPIADFAGSRNWGYDGVALFAPARCYGTPDDLRRLVDAAHCAGLAVLLDVVYNHFGPDGAYASLFSPYYFSDRHHSPWGAGINLDGPHADAVRAFFTENALHWLHEYRIDGLRLDATHAIVDESADHFLHELTRRIRASIADRHVLVIAEDSRNLATIITPPERGGWGLDAVWADDFHHQVRRLAAGDVDGYFQDFSGSTTDLATTLRQGWFYCGQYSAHKGAPRGSDPSALPLERFVICLQNHDQVGNRAFGERLHHQVDLAVYRALVTLLLTAPETPLLFMGQEWAATTPFLYFTDHEPELGKLVTEGRRREFQWFSAFTDPGLRERIPDPQAATTCDASRLRWPEIEHEPHASVRRLYRELLRLRRTDAVIQARDGGHYDAAPAGDAALVVSRTVGSGDTLLVAVQLRGAGTVNARDVAVAATGTDRTWVPLLTTEDPQFAPRPQPIAIEASGPIVRFARPGAVVLHTS